MYRFPFAALLSCVVVLSACSPPVAELDSPTNDNPQTAAEVAEPTTAPTEPAPPSVEVAPTDAPSEEGEMAEDEADLVTSIDCARPDEGSLDYVACNIQDAIRASNLYAAAGYMADPFTIGYWRSEGVSLSPADAVAEMDASRLPEDRSAITFEADPAAFPNLDGMDPMAIFGPEVDLRLMLFSQGWGEDGQGEAILYFTEDADGFLWHGLLFSGEAFDS